MKAILISVFLASGLTAFAQSKPPVVDICGTPDNGIESTQSLIELLSSQVSGDGANAVFNYLNRIQAALYKAKADAEISPAKKAQFLELSKALCQNLD